MTTVKMWEATGSSNERYICWVQLHLHSKEKDEIPVHTYHLCIHLFKKSQRLGYKDLPQDNDKVKQCFNRADEKSL